MQNSAILVLPALVGSAITKSSLGSTDVVLLQLRWPEVDVRGSADR